ncbi:hypothetical protein M569_01624, partial [Genlisea aurea]
NKRSSIFTAVTATLGCGSLCRRPKLSAVFQPRPRQRRPPPRRRQYAPSSSWDNTTTTATTTFSAALDTPPRCCYSSSDNDSDARSLRAVRGFGKIGGESVAVEKDSDDPYNDFRQSMLQMILENEIYSKEDLKELLNCFLQLNSPYYHGIIVQAFTEIWNG